MGEQTPDDGHLDACDQQGILDSEKVTTDDDLANLVLFADVDFTDPDAVTARKAEWRELLG